MREHQFFDVFVSSGESPAVRLLVACAVLLSLAGRASAQAPPIPEPPPTETPPPPGSDDLGDRDPNLQDATLVPLRAVVEDPNAVVARVGGVILRAGELAAVIADLPAFERARLGTPPALAEFARRVLATRALATEARRRGLERDPLFAFRVDEALVQAVVEREIAREPIEVTMASARAYYDAHAAELTRAAQTRVQALVFASRETAARAMANAERRRGSEVRFRALVRSVSIDRGSRARGGGLGWIYPGSRHDPAIAAAAMALENVGDLSAPVEGADGRIYVLRLAERTPPVLIPFERLGQSIASRLRRQLIDERRDAAARALAGSDTPIVNVGSRVVMRPAE